MCLVAACTVQTSGSCQIVQTTLKCYKVSLCVNKIGSMFAGTVPLTEIMGFSTDEKRVKIVVIPIPIFFIFLSLSCASVNVHRCHQKSSVTQQTRSESNKNISSVFFSLCGIRVWIYDSWKWFRAVSCGNICSCNDMGVQRTKAFVRADWHQSWQKKLKSVSDVNIMGHRIRQFPHTQNRPLKWTENPFPMAC